MDTITCIHKILSVTITYLSLAQDSVAFSELYKEHGQNTYSNGESAPRSKCEASGISQQ